MLYNSFLHDGLTAKKQINNNKLNKKLKNIAIYDAQGILIPS